MSEAPSLVLVSIGNTRTRFAVGTLPGSVPGQLEPSLVHENSDVGALAQALAAEADRAGATLVIVASVNDAVADELSRRLERTDKYKLQRFGQDLPVPVATTLTDESTVGQDRLLSALGAYARSSQACIVIDAGTAVTVDFVDGEGTFHGGAIAPGLRMMRDVLHGQTAALPRAEIAARHLHAPGEPPFGKNTVEAINLGVTSCVIGMVHLLIDRYAEFYQAYPRVVATGGDAPLLFENDPLVEHIVPDLVLVGMLAACETLTVSDDEIDDAMP